MSIELGTLLDDCKLVYKNARFDGAVSEPFRHKIEHYVRDVCGDDAVASTHVWFDTKEKRLFSDAQYVIPRNAGKDQNFFVPPQQFGDILTKYVSKINDQIPLFQNHSLVRDTAGEFLISNVRNHFDKYAGKKIMIVCGGPSTNEVDWEAVDYDYLWTCNEFYKNDKLRDTKIDFATLAPIVALDDKTLNDTIRRDDTMIAFPLVTNYLYDNISLKSVKSFVERHPFNSCHWYTRYSSVIGTGVRMVALAVLSGATEVYFVGVDGRDKVEKDGKLLHSFDGNKPVPNWYKTHGDRFQVRQNLIFWDYMMFLKQNYDFMLYNLGEGKPYNTLTTISEILCPLEASLKTRIGLCNDRKQ